MATASAALDCAFCGNSISAHGTDAMYGRCGGAVCAWPATDRLDPESLRIRENVPCKSCGYNLRTLPLDGVCPECAARVTLSLLARIDLVLLVLCRRMFRSAGRIRQALSAT